MEEKRKPTRWGLWLAVGMGLLVAYPLSLGPAFRFAVLGYVPETVFEIGYEPLRCVASPFPAIKQLEREYILWWSPVDRKRLGY
jgi:hypothetical protein